MQTTDRKNATLLVNENASTGAGNPATHAINTLLVELNHEIRTAMNGVVGMLDALLDSGLSSSQQHLASTAQHSAENLLGFIETVVDLALIGEDQLALESHPFELSAEIETAVAAVYGPDFRTQQTLPTVLLEGDRLRIRQIVMGLLRVASCSGCTVNPAVRAACLDSHCNIRIEIDAPGLAETSPQLIELVEHPGTKGVEVLPAFGRPGLDIERSKQLARLMGGRIFIERHTEAKCVLCFEAALPLATPAPAGEVAEADFTGHRILVADDNPVNQKVAQHMLERLGCRVDIAADGRQTLAMHETHPYDLILMDCQMPVMDGREATARLRALEGVTKRTPVVALTASATQQERVRCLAAGMDDFLAKPVRPRALAAILSKWLAQAASKPVTEKSGREDELEQVRGIFGANFAELASLYQADSPTRIMKLRAAGSAGDNATVARIAHALSGSSASIGATGLSALCKELEKHAQTGSLEDIEQRLAVIETEYGRICSRMQSLIKPS